MNAPKAICLKNAVVFGVFLFIALATLTIKNIKHIINIIILTKLAGRI